MVSSWPWPSSQDTGKVIPAFVKALQGVDDVTKGRKVNAGQMRYAYADLSDVLDVTKPVLATNGLAVTQAVSTDGVHTVLMHSSGEWLSFPPLTVTTGQNTPQAQGSAATYARRYSLLGALGIATEDDDGHQASQQPRQTPLASPTQLKSLGTLLRARIGSDRDAGLTLIAQHVGHSVNSSKELTTAEASQIISALQAEDDDNPEEAT